MRHWLGAYPYLKLSFLFCPSPVPISDQIFCRQNDSPYLPTQKNLLCPLICPSKEAHTYYLTCGASPQLLNDSCLSPEEVSNTPSVSYTSDCFLRDSCQTTTVIWIKRTLISHPRLRTMETLQEENGLGRPRKVR